MARDRAVEEDEEVPPAAVLRLGFAGGGTTPRVAAGVVHAAESAAEAEAARPLEAEAFRYSMAFAAPLVTPKASLRAEMSYRLKLTRICVRDVRTCRGVCVVVVVVVVVVG